MEDAPKYLAATPPAPAAVPVGGGGTGLSPERLALLRVRAESQEGSSYASADVLSLLDSVATLAARAEAEAGKWGDYEHRLRNELGGKFGQELGKINEIYSARLAESEARAEKLAARLREEQQTAGMQLVQIDDLRKRNAMLADDNLSFERETVALRAKLAREGEAKTRLAQELLAEFYAGGHPAEVGLFSVNADIVAGVNIERGNNNKWIKLRCAELGIAFPPIQAAHAGIKPKNDAAASPLGKSEEGRPEGGARG
jgi:hypothetical protein